VHNLLLLLDQVVLILTGHCHLKIKVVVSERESQVWNHMRVNNDIVFSFWGELSFPLIPLLLTVCNFATRLHVNKLLFKLDSLLSANTLF